MDTNTRYEEKCLSAIGAKITGPDPALDNTKMVQDSRPLEPAVIPKGKLCPSCGSRETFTWKTQMSSGDEPETETSICTMCSRRF